MNRLFALLLLFPLIAHASTWDREFWQYWKWKQWQKYDFEFYASGVGRLDQDCSHFYYGRVTENVRYKWNKNLDLEAHYSYISSKTRGERKFLSSHRGELEVNPSWSPCKNLQLKWRNRMQFIKKEDESRINYVSRHLFRVDLVIKNCGMLTSIGFQDECFYHYREGRITENRFVPLNITFAISSKISLNTGIMIRNFISSGRWFRSFVFTSEFSF